MAKPGKNKASDSREIEQQGTIVVPPFENWTEPQKIAVGSFVWNLDDNSMQCSANTHSLVRLDSVSSLSEALSIIHPGDRARFLRETEAMISERQTRPIEFRVVLADGTEKVLFAIGEFVCDSRRKPIRCSGVVCDITESKRVDEALKRTSQLRNLVTSISTRFINLDSEEIDSAIQTALCRLGGFADVDRSYVFLLSDDGKKITNTHEWCARGITPEMLRIQHMPVERLPWLHERLMRFEIVHVPDVSKLPKSAKAEKVEFHTQEIRSLIIVPMVVRRVLTGFVGFDSVRQHKIWSEDIVAVLKLVGEIIANAIDRKRAEIRLKQSEAKYRALFNDSSDAIFLLKDSRCIDCNSQSERMFGYSRDSMIGSTPSRFSPLFQPDGSKSSEKAPEMVSKALTGTPQAFEWVHRRQDGSLIDTEITLTVIYLGDETLVQSIVRDITDRKLAENELEVSRKRLQSLANHLISVREDEKSHIARELHDELGQVLTALNMDLKWLGGKLKKNRPVLTGKTDQMAELVMQTIRTVKRIQGELRPTLLDNLGLIAAMEWQVKEFQERTGLDVSFVHPEDIRTDAGRAIALFRIFQEAQTNVAKHAKASKVEIDLSETEDHLSLTVTDNGRGIRPEDFNQPGSFGLLGISERISSLQGQFSISTKDGIGTRLYIQIPK